MDSLWYYRVLGREYGPVDLDELARLIDQGRLSPLDQVRSNCGLRSMSVQAALNASGADDRTTDLVDDRSELGINDIVIEKSSRVDPGSSHTNPAKGPQAVTVTQPAADTSESAEEKFYLRSGDTTIGPLSSAALSRMADAGKISAHDWIGSDADAKWQLAEEHPLVMAATLITTSVRQEPEDFDVDERLLSENQSVSEPQRKTSKPRRKSPKKKKGQRRPRSAGAYAREDKQLEEIFDEVFGEEDTRQAPSHQQHSSTTAVTARPEITNRSTSEIAETLQAGSTAVKPLSIPQKPLWTPPAPAKKPKSGSLLSGFQAKYLVIAAGIAVVIGLGTLLPGVVSAFIGQSLPDQALVKTKLSELAGRYDQAATSADKWKEFGEEVRSVTKEWINSYRTNTGSRTPRDIELQEATTALVQLVNSRMDDKKKHKTFLKKIEEKA